MGTLLSRRKTEDVEAGRERTNNNNKSDLVPSDMLEQILEGKTCTPLSLSEFREFLGMSVYV